MAALVAVAGWLAAAPASAGCGCDHPPPEWAPIMPPFAVPGWTVTLHDESGGDVFQVGETYQVDFGFGQQHVVADHPQRLRAVVPPGSTVGPVAVKVDGPGFVHEYGDHLFTALAPPPVMPASPGTYAVLDHPMAVAADGTALVAVDVTAVLDPMQFAMALVSLPLEYSADDVVIYNFDGVDLTLFTLDVENATERQWGQYYGWNVENDSGMRGDWFGHEVLRSLFLANVSSVFSYWRHEFHTYAAAHAPGGSHETDADGFHPDGTLHVDHYQLVVAISNGTVRDSSHPEDPTRNQPLEPGEHRVNAVWKSVLSEGPVDVSFTLEDFHPSGVFLYPRLSLGD